MGRREMMTSTLQRRKEATVIIGMILKEEFLKRCKFYIICV